MPENKNNPTEVAILGAGCFWCTEAVFQNLKGVASVLPGYTGGSVPNPSYEQVCSHTTGHIEVAKIEFNPKLLPFKTLLEVFFALHDPTTLNRQGNDVGDQYASAIFYSSEQQKQTAKEVISDLEKQKVFDSPIVTQIRPLEKFYLAENYHQNYYNNNPGNPYCQTVISPKVAKLRKKFAQLLARNYLSE